MNKLIVIVGPTASGKTDLATKLANFFSGEIVSADSRQIYKGMDIGTNKIKGKKVKKGKETVIIYKGIPHYLIDILKPNQEFTVAQFKIRAIKIIKDIQKRKKIPFLVGGTGLYIKAVVDNLKIPKVKPDKKLRKKLEKEIKKRGLNWAWRKLLKLDPEAKEFVQKDNPRRIIRALEVCLKTKKKFSELRKVGKPLFDTLQLGIKISRKSLYKRINQRVEKMIKAGLIDEVKNLLKKYPPTLPSLTGIGYKEIISYLNGKISLKEAIEEIKKNTRHFARRQITWFKKDKRIYWIKNYQEAKKIIKNFLSS